MRNINVEKDIKRLIIKQLKTGSWLEKTFQERKKNLSKKVMEVEKVGPD